MAHPYYHARSSARRHGGVPEDYLPIHRWFDSTKSHLADARHRLWLHNTFGIFLCEQVFGVTFARPSDGKPIPTRLIAEQHVLEDLRHIPTLEEWARDIPIKASYYKGALPLSQILEQEDDPNSTTAPDHRRRADATAPAL